MKLRVKSLKHFLGEGWNVQPAGGATGEAYVARQGDRKIFIKRNSSPFLAVLSAEGIVPKLLWTRRLESGDVITAQEWVNGRKLSANDMRQVKVPKLLAKIHRSNELLSMFLRLGNSPITPQKQLKAMQEKIISSRIDNKNVIYALDWLIKNVDELNYSDFVVCHSDVHHNNWIMCDDQLYLIDWDGAVISDPAIDLAPILYLYVQREDWDAWLKEYDIALTHSLLVRLQWYMVVHCIDNIFWFWNKQDEDEVAKWQERINDVIHESIHSNS